MSRSPVTHLFDHLVDDAAVFPPGLAPTDVAVREHLDLRAGPYAAQLGPLLVPATAAGELARQAAREPRTTGSPLEVGLIVRPGSPLEPLLDAVELLRDEPGVDLVTVEVGWSDDWRRALESGVPVVVEVGLGVDQMAGLDDIAVAVADGAEVRAKFRTGRTPAWDWPDEPTLARFLGAVVERDLSFKLTGGLHHAVRGTYGGEPMHGLLNVIIATHEALAGDDARQLVATLSQPSAEVLAESVARLTPDEAARTRASFAAYGCCGVLEPLSEVDALGLLPERTAR